MDCLAGYERYLRERKSASPNTLSSYLRDIRQYLVWLEGEGLPPERAAQGDVERYIRDLTGRGKSPATVTRTRSPVRR